MAKCFGKLAASHDQLASDANDDNSVAAQHHRDASSCCKSMQAEHVKAGENHLADYKRVDAFPTNEGPESSGVDRGSSELKSIVDRLEKLLTPGVSAIPTSMPRMVPRNGQPERTETVAVDPDLDGIIYDRRQARG